MKKTAILSLKVLENKIDLEEAKKVLDDVKNHGSVSWEDAKRALKLESTTPTDQ